MINVTKNDLTLKPRKIIGSIHPVSKSIAPCAVSDNELPHPHPDLSNIQFGENLTAKQKEAAQNLIDQYADVFALNPKKPKQTNLMEHRIITPDALPVNNEPRQFPKAWEPKIDQQITEMPENNIIRPSCSPWNAPIILVKKKDNSTRFVCDFRS